MRMEAKGKVFATYWKDRELMEDETDKKQALWILLLLLAFAFAFLLLGKY
jgi:hypothetical protein